jgi:hypothetical protein
MDSASTATFCNTATCWLILDDVETAFIEQPSEFLNARVLRFTAGEIHRRQPFSSASRCFMRI